jgi:hypothetical protein
LIAGDTLDGAIAATVVYFDVFACAPTSAEIHRFLVGRRASRAEVERALSESRDLAGTIASRDGVWHLHGKAHLAPRRVRFLEHSKKLWPKARRIARMVELSGLATCGMVTGSLAADNCDEHADIDFLLTYPADRAWSSYAAVRMLAKVPTLGVSGFCPNYALPEDRLEIRPQNLFTAWEIAKAVPLFGFDVYQRMILANRWVARLLPNALPMLESPGPIAPGRRDSPLVRAIVWAPPFRWIEAAERRRKFKQDARDVGVDMHDRTRRGSVDRHAPTRSFQTLSELRYRMDMFGLEAHPLYREIADWTSLLDGEMTRWSGEEISPLFRGGEAARASEAP